MFLGNIFQVYNAIVCCSGLCITKIEREKTETWPLSLASMQQEKQISWVRMCGSLLLKLLLCPSTHHPHTPCIQSELQLPSALLPLQSAHMLLSKLHTQKKKTCNRTERLQPRTSWSRREVKMGFQRALQQISNYPPCPHLHALPIEPVIMEISLDFSWAVMKTQQPSRIRSHLQGQHNHMLYLCILLIQKHRSRKWKKSL